MKYELRPRLRVTRGDSIVLGPGKAELLEAIEQTGSIRDAASELDMSYMRAWSLIRVMNSWFREPLVEALRGGAKRGGATLTPAGRQVLRLYRTMTAASTRASRPAFARLQRLLR